MKWFLIYAILLFSLWHAIDLQSDSVFPAVFAPLAFFFVLLAFLVWLVTKMSGHSSSTGDIGSGGFFGGGGDSGGGDGGC
ncbi:hypothetical protein [Halopseudomonas salegens]|uniref:hypothetical protein n=1 Tax=Halopseudomonas salegens TaxID=1434072 RepID=UPI000B895AD7|nr:hypothetical protein [Halopseudomonas salegens]